MMAKPMKRKRGVTFNQIVVCKQVKRLSASEGHDLWLNCEDLTEIKRNCRDTLRSAMKATMAGHSPESGGICLRGLETKTKGIALRCKIRRQRAVRAVLEVQRRQAHAKVEDPEKISYIYKKMTEGAAAEAQVHGLIDQASVQRPIIAQNQKTTYLLQDNARYFHQCNYAVLQTRRH